ncbi:unnamed protein product, partial [Citrullus colocynthis]
MGVGIMPLPIGQHTKSVWTIQACCCKSKLSKSEIPKLEYTSNDQVVVVDDMPLFISHVGDSAFTSPSSSLKLCVPLLAKDNNVVEFHSVFCVIKDKILVVELVKGTLRDRLYQL